MKHIDLYSGLGGFALACDWAGIETIGFVEIDKFCQKVLKKHWPGVPIVEDVNNVEEIKRIVANAYCQRQQQPQGVISEVGGRTLDRNQVTADTNFRQPEQGYGDSWQSLALSGSYVKSTPDTTNNDGRESSRRGAYSAGLCNQQLLLTAGFPCQPFSNAGRKRGASDDRYLWPQTLAVIESVKPDWIVLENVTGILSMVFPDKASPMAGQASLFGGQNDEIADYDTIAGGIDRDLRQAGYETGWLIIPACAVSAPHRRDRVWIIAHAIGSRAGSDNGETSNERGRAREDRGARVRQGNGQTSPGGTDSADRDVAHWQENWYEVATRVCRVDDGLPKVVDRTERLKALGNAIVPEVAYRIIKAIKGGV